MNATLAALLADRKPGKRGIHGTANWSTSADYYEQQFDDWLACGFSWVKLVVGGDSQVDTVRRMRKTGIIPVIRFYKTDCPNNTVAPDLCKPYIDEGVVVFESPFNEFYAPYENVWGAQGMPHDWPAQVAHGWALFAASVLKAGGVPTTPAIEGWRYADIFEPLFAVLCTTYRDTLKQSCIAMHNRPLNHPIDYAKDTGGYLAWRSMDAYVFNRLGEHVPMIATEAGPEPGWDQDRTYPRVTPELHAQMAKDTVAYKTPDYYLADCFWLWHDDGTFGDASWSRNRSYAHGGDLPAVNLLQTWREDAATPDLTSDGMRALAERHGQEIRIFPDGAIYKRAQEYGLGYPVTNEWPEYGRIWQRYENPVERTKSVVSCRATTYDDLRQATWLME